MPIDERPPETAPAGAVARHQGDITLDELLACLSGGEVIVAQRVEDGAFVHIEDAEPGLSCRCVCPGCGGTMVARHGTKRRHTFAHYADFATLDCRRSGETALHKFAKDLLARELRLKLPPVTVSDDLGSLRVADGRILDFEGAEIEKRTDDVVPDVIVRKGDRDLHVEFNVTHPCDEAKTRLLKSMGASALEIDLSGYREFKLRELGEVILMHAERRWINTRLTEVGERMLAERRETAERETAAAAERVADAYAALPVLEAFEAKEWEARAAAHDLGFLVASQPKLRSCFCVRDEEWKGFSLLRYGYRLRRGFSQADLLRDLVRHEWVMRPFGEATPPVARRVREMGFSDFVCPQEELDGYLRGLERLGYFAISEMGKVTAQKQFVWLVEGSYMAPNSGDQPLA
ncbi:MAG: hypothetical protein EOR63_32445 [Mesorhizobium sp.]|nr:MAG: hypothetical protein EOR63_32445 [Mesorhizobium sp.]